MLLLLMTVHHILIGLVSTTVLAHQSTPLPPLDLMYGLVVVKLAIGCCAIGTLVAKKSEDPCVYGQVFLVAVDPAEFLVTVGAGVDLRLVQLALSEKLVFLANVQNLREQK